MKNTVKKILALVFAVVMVCSLAVPALAAAEDDITVAVKVVGRDGDVLVDKDVVLTAKNQNLEKALKDTDVAAVLKVSGGKVSSIEGVKVTHEDIVGEFGTGSIVVAVNGKAVSEDFATVAVEAEDVITVYWADSKLGTKLAMVDESRLKEGIVSLYYYDAEGNRQPLKGASITLIENEVPVENKLLDSAYDRSEHYFVTDEKGQIWISPDKLDGATTFTIAYAHKIAVEVDADKEPVVYENETESEDPYKDDPAYYCFEEGKYYKFIEDAVSGTIVSALKKVTKDNSSYVERERNYYNANLKRNVEDVEVIGYEIVVAEDMYQTADATGDMTMVYVLVAAAAVITLAAVVVMKKKAVKAN